MKKTKLFVLVAGVLASVVLSGCGTPKIIPPVNPPEIVETDDVKTFEAAALALVPDKYSVAQVVATRLMFDALTPNEKISVSKESYKALSDAEIAVSMAEGSAKTAVEVMDQLISSPKVDEVLVNEAALIYAGLSDLELEFVSEEFESKLEGIIAEYVAYQLAALNFEGQVASVLSKEFHEDDVVELRGKYDALSDKEKHFVSQIAVDLLLEAEVCILDAKGTAKFINDSVAAMDDDFTIEAFTVITLELLRSSYLVMDYITEETTARYAELGRIMAQDTLSAEKINNLISEMFVHPSEELREEIDSCLENANLRVLQLLDQEKLAKYLALPR